MDGHSTLSRLSHKAPYGFEGARVEGDFDCSGGRFTAAAFRDLNARAKPKRQEHLEAILADGLHVGGDMFFSFEKSSNTEVVVRGAVSLIST